MPRVDRLLELEELEDPTGRWCLIELDQPRQGGLGLTVEDDTRRETRTLPAPLALRLLATVRDGLLRAGYREVGR